jgi:ribonuclease BN (tRNA processing enzyme)
VAFTGDSGPGPGLSRLCEGVDLLVAECADGLGPGSGRHLDVQGLVDLAVSGGVGRVAVVHLDPRRDRAAVLAELGRRLGDRLIEGRDGLRIEV